MERKVPHGGVIRVGKARNRLGPSSLSLVVAAQVVLIDAELLAL